MWVVFEIQDAKDYVVETKFQLKTDALAFIKQETTGWPANRRQLSKHVLRYGDTLYVLDTCLT